MDKDKRKNLILPCRWYDGLHTRARKHDLWNVWDHYWDEAEVIEKEKRGTNWHRQWTSDYPPAFVGFLGGHVYTRERGGTVNTKHYRGDGDGGVDILDRKDWLGLGWPGLIMDIKGVAHYNDPHLKWVPGDRKADIYVLVGLDMVQGWGCLVGWATGDELHWAAKHDYGHGAHCRIPWQDLHPFDQEEPFD